MFRVKGNTQLIFWLEETTGGKITLKCKKEESNLVWNILEITPQGITRHNELPSNLGIELDLEDIGKVKIIS